MGKRYFAALKEQGTDHTFIGAYDSREEAVIGGINYCEEHVGHCLDTKESRMKQLEHSNFCILGCGPLTLTIWEEDTI